MAKNRDISWVKLKKEPKIDWGYQTSRSLKVKIGKIPKNLEYG